ncbi:SDR family oxidoreductase [Antrihabitans sp. YC2-6]|uniref:SDR family oxidoreductase n=1 Tax=Antrihabitans sp. YC2-6 TaxID=2799498 RepID=UPI0018F3DEE3|nr:SDR family oxidoreductase [Antrihabitans sp. YC2-6]MBJ8347738.1 SDR family oxidoreductase [Antrihabitans sp. YC2-6]
MKVVIVGGTGLIGTKVRERLEAAGHAVVVATPSTGVNAATGEGLAEAVSGADVVVDVSNAPIWEPQELIDFFATSTGNQLRAEQEAGVAHHIAVSIVGAERAPDNFYMAAKLVQEQLIQDGAVPWTIVKATQFFEFLRGIADQATSDGQVRVTEATLQPIAADDVADRVVEAVIGGPAGVVEIAGPEAVGLADLVRTVLEADGDPRTVVADHAAGYFGSVIEDDTLVPTPGVDAWIAEQNLATWLASQKVSS